MCLSSIDDVKTERFKKEKSPITAYKVVEEKRTMKGEECVIEHFPIHSETEKKFKKGVNKAKIKKIAVRFPDGRKSYRSGFHSFFYLIDAIDISKDYICGKKRVIEIKINPKDIMYIGSQYNCPIIVSSRIKIDSFDDMICKN